MIAGRAPRRILRSIGAVVAGMLAVVILSIATDVALRASAVYPPLSQPMADSLLVLATAYRAAYAVAGSYIAAWLAPDRPMRHALVVGLVGFAMGVAGAVVAWNAEPVLGPRWYPIAIIAIAMPCAWAGGRLRGIQRCACGSDSGH